MLKGLLYISSDFKKVKGVEVLPSILNADKDPFCFRCGNNEKIRFARLPNKALYCRNCLKMGRISCNDNLYYLKPDEQDRMYFENPLEFEGTLSHAQQGGAEAVLKAIRTKKPLLLWAVAGSGKTEMMFPGIEEGLKKGLRICLASPRVDVCIELAPRLKEAFPDVPQACLYGSSNQTFAGEPFVVATTHQLMRFYHYFDLIFIDEVDAFPFAKDPFLEYAVQKAGCPESVPIYVTATPERKWQLETLKGERNYIKIPARYHGFPLPVPKACWVGDWQKALNKKQIPSKVLKWIKKIRYLEKPILIFFPTIDVMFQFKDIIQAYGFSDIETVHAADELRKEKVDQLRERKISILLTTTILERGVTFSDVQVAVFGSEGPIFTEAALVQISGRVGRKKDFPSGEVWFFHYGKTKEMIRAIQHIKLMNKLGYEEGLLNGG